MSDPTEEVRRAMIDSHQPQRDLDSDTGQQWTTEEVQRDFNVLGFMAPFVVVERKSDGVRGSLEFSPSPKGRVYFGWKADE